MTNDYECLCGHHAVDHVLTGSCLGDECQCTRFELKYSVGE